MKKINNLKDLTELIFFFFTDRFTLCVSKFMNKTTQDHIKIIDLIIFQHLSSPKNKNSHFFFFGGGGYLFELFLMNLFEKFNPNIISGYKSNFEKWNISQIWAIFDIFLPFLFFGGRFLEFRKFFFFFRSKKRSSGPKCNLANQNLFRRSS